MAHFAKLDDKNIVIAVHVLSDDVATSEQVGIDFLKNLTTWQNWKQTSYHTSRGTHSLGGTPLRKNYAAPGYTYDENRDAFIPPKGHDSCVLNEDTCIWEIPVARPIDGNVYNWNEVNQTWDLVADPGEQLIYILLLQKDDEITER